MTDIAIRVKNLSKPHPIGSGQATSILELAALLCRLTAPRLAPQISAAARVGDIRHCTADNAAAGAAFGCAARAGAGGAVEMLNVFRCDEMSDVGSSNMGRGSG